VLLVQHLADTPFFQDDHPPPNVKTPGRVVIQDYKVYILNSKDLFLLCLAGLYTLPRQVCYRHIPDFGGRNA
jgi:hypothetical protein